MSRMHDVAPACAWVAQRADHVKIHAERIPGYAGFILEHSPVVTELSREHHHIANDNEETAAYILALDSINFGSGYFSIAKACGIHLEYAVIAGGLKQAFEQGELKTPQQWVQATPADFSRWLAVPQGVHPQLDELLALFARHLRETGEKILLDHRGKVVNLLERTGYSAVKLADTVAEWNGFHDVHFYKGRDIPILKRAQILAADMNLALSGLADMAALTAFADNMVPHVLRCDGILSYKTGHAVPGSPEEIEIRACAIHAVEMMKRAAPENITAVNIDHMLWQRGYEPEIYQQPRHETQTVFY